MSSAPVGTPDPDTLQHSAKISAHVTHHSIVPGLGAASGAKAKSKPKEKKETKTKEFMHVFEATEANYLALLKTILAKHSEDKYNITEKMTYSIKVQLPSVKKSDAVDIENFDEYNDLAKDILESLPPKMTIFVDMAEIQKRWSGRGFNRGSDDEDVHGDDPGLYDSNGLSDVERELARLRRKLEKEYQNDHDAGYTYIDPDTGESYLLTPQLMKEWCRAMYDGEATFKTPPSSVKGFDPAKRKVALHPMRIAAGVNQTPGSNVSDVGHIANMITALVQGGTSIPLRQQEATPPRRAPAIIDSPARPTPTKLPRFLEHAKIDIQRRSPILRLCVPCVVPLTRAPPFCDPDFALCFPAACPTLRLCTPDFATPRARLCDAARPTFAHSVSPAAAFCFLPVFSRCARTFRLCVPPWFFRSRFTAASRFTTASRSTSASPHLRLASLS
ncbi:hypothetical protein B0H13DRAFT_2342680 [Mycena leptocephala]|nr:hypothetical protein B0H13DRAFT_2342680 [Mycena leptocephala]